MVCSRKYLFSQVLVIVAVALGEEFRFPLSSDQPVIFTAHHWQHPESNSTMDINGIGVDVFQWRAAVESLESVEVDLVNLVWEYAGWTNDDIVLPESITISKVLNFRGTPTVNIKVAPWRIIGNEVEVLTGGEIRIWVEPANFPITFSHPHLLNGGKQVEKRATTDETEYLIICPSEFKDAAESLAVMHSSDVAAVNIDILITKVESKDDITAGDLREFIIDRIDEDYALDGFLDLKFLLLFGDETHLPPIFNESPSFPSDDFYSTEDSLCCNPQLYTGRIPVSTAGDASTVVNKIREYILTPTPGLWRSKVALVADDMRKELCAIAVAESSHTSHSQKLYDTLKSLLPVQPIYGVHYSLHNCAYPNLTRNLIQTINNGVALINYIGHGDTETWAGERLLNKSRDLPLIHASDNRLAIWVAGTCSFGDYYNNNSFMEDLLIKEDGAIAVVATTDAITPTSNWNYIKHLFGIDNDSGIASYINNDVDIRLGKLVGDAKTPNDYIFHTFGDPALPLPFPKIDENLVDEYPENIKWVKEDSISFVGSPQHSSILIRNNENEYIFDYESDSLIYTIPETYVQMDVSGSSTCFRIPEDAGTCDGCIVIQAYQEDETGWKGYIETLPNISLLSSDENFDDKQGPEILLSQGTRNVSHGTAIYPNIDLTISIEDESGINLMNTIGHKMYYKFDDYEKVMVTGNEFIYTNCSGGFVKVPVPLSASEGIHQFRFEAWDGVNNKSTMEIYLDLLPPINEDKLNLSKVYPIPSPFSESTHFTMISTHFPVDIIINIFSLNGLNIRTLNKSIISINDCFETYSEDDGCFINIAWDGKDKNAYKIANGAYFYHVRAETQNGKLFEDIYKFAKIE